MGEVTRTSIRKLESFDDRLPWASGHCSKRHCDKLLSTPVLSSHHTIAPCVQSGHVADLSGNPLYHPSKIYDVVHVVVISVLGSSLCARSKAGDVNFTELLLELVSCLPLFPDPLFGLLLKPGSKRGRKACNCLQYVFNGVVGITLELLIHFLIWYEPSSSNGDKGESKDNWRSEEKHVDCEKCAICVAPTRHCLSLYTLLPS